MKTCFVIMPFDEEMQQVYDYAIKPAGEIVFLYNNGNVVNVSSYGFKIKVRLKIFFNKSALGIAQ